MEYIFYVNTLFDKNKNRILNELKNKIFSDSMDYRFQIHPFRNNIISEQRTLNDDPITMDIFKTRIKQHMDIMKDINSSDIETRSKPFKNIIFVNYSTKELERAIEFDRIRIYLCDFINEHNIEILTLISPIYINFYKRITNREIILNSVFMNYTTLTFYDSETERRIGNATSLDLGEETEDDETFLLRSQMRLVQVSEYGNDITKQGIFLPYHPFKRSFFASMQNIKDNINIITSSSRRSLIYFPFEQKEWLLILRNIMYERIFLNFLTSPSLYIKENINIYPRLFRNSVSYNYRKFRKIQKRNKTHVLNVLIFNYKNAFTNNMNVYGNWYNLETNILNIHQAPFTTDILCIKSSSGFLI